MGEESLSKQRRHAIELCSRLQRNRQSAGLLAAVIKLMASEDLVIKRVCYSSYARHAQKTPSEALLAVNTILKDAEHPSPIVRCLVLASIMMIKSEAIISLFHKTVKEKMRDGSMIVRRHAIIARHRMDQQSGETTDISDLIFDSDPIVSSLALQYSHLATPPQERVVFSVLNNITKYTTDGLCELMSTLTKYCPSNTQQLLDILSILDSYLDNPAVDVSLSTMDVFVLYSEQVNAEISADIWKRLTEHCVFLLKSPNETEVYSVLLWMQENMDLRSLSQDHCCLKLIGANFHLVLGRIEEAEYITVAKLELLIPVLNRDNIAAVCSRLTELLGTARTPELCDCIAHALIEIRPLYPSECTEVVLSILKPGISDNTMIVMFKHLREFIELDSEHYEELTPRLMKLWSSMDEQTIMLLLTVIGRFAHIKAENHPFVSQLSKQILKGSNPMMQSALLAALLQCFLAQPAEYEAVFCDTLTQLRTSPDVIVANQVRWSLRQIKQLKTYAY